MYISPIYSQQHSPLPLVLSGHHPHRAPFSSSVPTLFPNHHLSLSQSSNFNPHLLHCANVSESSATTDSDSETPSEEDNGVDVEIVKLGKNERRITCRIAIDANLETVWNVLTDYEKLADFIPGLAVCQLLDKSDGRARLFQIGQQNLAFGLKFNAKGIVDCYERDLERIPFGQRRDIEFKMIEGDFQVFDGKWSIEEMDRQSADVVETSVDQKFQTTLSYVVDVKPKLWLPIGLVEGRLCKEITLNLVCIREQAQKAVSEILLTPNVVDK